jgi:hypothetical protein
MNSKILNNKILNNKILTTSLIAALAMVLFIAGCSNDATSPPIQANDQGDLLSAEELKAFFGRLPAGVPGEEEIADLTFMREEEKLAFDVYTVLFDQYGLPIFSNIAASELNHTEAVLRLLDRYGLEDPVGDNGPGEFVNEDLQALYGNLVDSGSQSLTNALLAGLAIEEIDILDLEAALARTELREILQVYGNLLDGSQDHLRAFVGVYESETGEVYVPRWLSQDAYDEILGEDSEPGRKGNRQYGRD